MDVTYKALAEDIHNCMTKAEEFEAETKSRGEPKALATKKIVKEATGAALDQATSFLQTSKPSSQVDLANFEVVRFVRDLAKKSAALAQLASRVASAVKFGSGNQADNFVALPRLAAAVPQQ